MLWKPELNVFFFFFFFSFSKRTELQVWTPPKKPITFQVKCVATAVSSCFEAFAVEWNCVMCLFSAGSRCGRRTTGRVWIRQRVWSRSSDTTCQSRRYCGSIYRASLWGEPEANERSSGLTIHLRWHLRSKLPPTAQDSKYFWQQLYFGNPPTWNEPFLKFVHTRIICIISN